MKKIYVSDYGITPGDNKDHGPAIKKAIEDAIKFESAQVIFEAGRYYICESEENAIIDLNNVSNLTVSGTVDESGNPATLLEFNRILGNDVPIKDHVRMKNSKNIKIENLIFDYTQRGNSSGEVIAVDKETDTVTVEVFEGLSHFEGMKCYSANAWNIKTRELLHVLPLTIGVDQATFSNTFHHVPNTNERTYAISNMRFSDRVNVGDGISWHFNVMLGNWQSCNVIRAINVEDLELENLKINSCNGPVAVITYSKNISIKRVTVKPEGNSLAVCSRDAFWLCCNSGKLIVEDSYIKGVRWDPFNARSGFAKVTAISKDRKQITAECFDEVRNPANAGQKLIVWEGEEPQENRIVDSKEDAENQVVVMNLEKEVPKETAVGSFVTPGGWLFSEAVFRNVTIEGNCGTGILYQNHNLLVENCRFGNNTYDDICLGPIDRGEGVFARNVIIRNSEFNNSTWIHKNASAPNGDNAIHDAAISVQSAYAALGDRPYNGNIVIENNIFRNENTAIRLKSSQNVTIKDNIYENVGTEVK